MVYLILKQKDCTYPLLLSLYDLSSIANMVYNPLSPHVKKLIFRSVRVSHVLFLGGGEGREEEGGGGVS